MSMTQLVIGTTLGFFAGQGLLYCLRHLYRWVLEHAPRWRIRPLTRVPAGVLVSGFVRYAPPLAVVAGLVTLGAWAVKDHFAAGRAGSHAPAVEALDPAGSGGAVADPHAAADDVAALNPPSDAPGATVSAAPLDPYSDPDFRAPPRPHHVHGAPSLKDTLLQREEAKARADLLRETQQQSARSQYDCEAALRAGKYLQAGLDVWGFAAWQLKYFPIDSYKGSTLPQCRDIKNVVDPTRLNLQSAVAQHSSS